MQEELDDIELEVRKERVRQTLKFGQQNLDPFKFLAILGEEVGEVSRAAIESFHWQSGRWNYEKLKHYREELIQVAAVAKQMVEAFDRGEW